MAISEMLHICQGNCFSDDDCKSGLKCHFKQIHNSSTSPCSEEVQTMFDSYCVPFDLPDVHSKEKMVGWSSKSSHRIRSECELGCNNDSDCEDGLSCKGIDDSLFLIKSRCNIYVPANGKRTKVCIIYFNIANISLI